MKNHLYTSFLLLLFSQQLFGQSIAREWNEVLLEAIRNDQARPTVHARNLFHISAAMYDAWAAYDEEASPYFLGQTHRGFYTLFTGASIPAKFTKQEGQKIALSYAAYRILLHRFEHIGNYRLIEQRANIIMTSLGLDIDYLSSSDYENNPADLGNYIAEQIIAFGMQDGSNEADGYNCRFYESFNDPMFPDGYGTNNISDPNRWQPLAFEEFVGQSGISSGPGTPKFVGPEWGQVVPFALTEDDLTIKYRDGHEYLLYHDPGLPAYLDLNPETNDMQGYQWGFTLVAMWASHHDPYDGEMWDISPRSIGNFPFDQFPQNIADLPNFYDLENGGDHSPGYDINPITGQAYEEQLVPRGDYSRVLAEFWADGPNSETPPGHWYVILNYVNDHPEFERKYKGEGSQMDALEWNVKSYFALGGTVHDAAVSAWGAKGYYDYIRPISAIRSMAERGQSSDPDLPNYHPAGIPLIPGHIEMIAADDPINEFGEFTNQIKIKTWKVPGVYYPGMDEDKRVDWIPATRWQPYQRPNFVTPPFAGYVSGHSTFSRAAAELMSMITGSEYFPGGMGEFHAPQNNFLVFEQGPSQDLILQWAKYADASDQCSLSRIWGGIHPPVDDINGRLIGYKVGHGAFALAERYFNGEINPQPATESQRITYGPNPVGVDGDYELTLALNQPDDLHKELFVINSSGQIVSKEEFDYIQQIELNTEGLLPGIYFVHLHTKAYDERFKIIVAP